MHPEFVRYTKGLGDAEIYALLVYGGGYWDFTLGGEVEAETPGCRVYLAEIPDSSVVESWYYGEITPPAGGPFPVQIMRASNGANIGNDLITSASAAVVDPVSSPISGRYVTRGQLAVKVLSALGVYDSTAVGSEEQQNVLDAYDAVYLELRDEGLVTWAQTGEDEQIPLRFLLSLVSMVAATDLLLATYPQTAQQVTLLKAAAVAADRKIRRQLASAQPTETVTAEYF